MAQSLYFQKSIYLLNQLQNSVFNEMILDDDRILLILRRETQNSVIGVLICLSSKFLNTLTGIYILDTQELKQISHSMGKAKRPLSNFTNMHFKGAIFSKCEWQMSFGQVIKLYFDEKENIPREFEVRLFSNGPNFIAKAVKKQVSLHKVLELKALNLVPLLSLEELLKIPDEKRDVLSLLEKESNKKSSSPVATPEEMINDKILKLQKRKTHLENDTKVKRDENWQMLGELLKTQQNIELLPENFKLLLPKKISFSEAIQYAFAKAKQQKQKIDKAQEQLLKIQNELDDLVEQKRNFSRDSNGQFKKKLLQSFSQIESFKKTEQKFLEKNNLNVRSLKLRDDIVLYVGKSAQDNAQLVKKSQAHDLWFHLRDYPSAHAVLRRNKNAEITPQELEAAALFLLQKNFGSKYKDKLGESFEVIYCECRFLKLSKSLGLGQVRFHNEKSMRVKIR